MSGATLGEALNALVTHHTELESVEPSYDAGLQRSVNFFMEGEDAPLSTGLTLDFSRQPHVQKLPVQGDLKADRLSRGRPALGPTGRTRAALLLIAAVAGLALLSGCGGSSGSSTTRGNGGIGSASTDGEGDAGSVTELGGAPLTDGVPACDQFGRILLQRWNAFAKANRDSADGYSTQTFESASSPYGNAAASPDFLSCDRVLVPKGGTVTRANADNYYVFHGLVRVSSVDVASNCPDSELADVAQPRVARIAKRSGTTLRICTSYRVLFASTNGTGWDANISIDEPVKRIPDTLAGFDENDVEVLAEWLDVIEWDGDSFKGSDELTRSTSGKRPDSGSDIRVVKDYLRLAINGDIEAACELFYEESRNPNLPPQVSCAEAVAASLEGTGIRSERDIEGATYKDVEGLVVDVDLPGGIWEFGGLYDYGAFKIDGFGEINP